MGMLLMVIGGLFWLAAAACGIMILISAFQSAVWKGFACLFTCGLYTLYFAFVEFEHEKKLPIILTWLLGGTAAGILTTVGSAMLKGGVPGAG